MTVKCFPSPLMTMAPVSSGQSIAGMNMAVGVFRLPTDPLFYANLTLINVVAGSRYRLTRHDTGAQLVLDVAGGSGMVDVTVTGVPCYANPMQVDISVRNASGGTKYKAFNTSAFLVKAGASAYIAQIPD